MAHKSCFRALAFKLKRSGIFFSAQIEVQNTEDIKMHHFLAAQETDQIMSDAQLAEMKNAVIKHMYFAAVSNNQFILSKHKI